MVAFTGPSSTTCAPVGAMKRPSEVPPDVEVEQWPAEVIAGRDPQLEAAIELTLEMLESDPPKQPQRPSFPVRVRR